MHNIPYIRLLYLNMVLFDLFTNVMYPSLEIIDLTPVLLQSPDMAEVMLKMLKMSAGVYCNSFYFQSSFYLLLCLSSFNIFP